VNVMNSDAPLIRIVIPSFNQGRFIAKTIHSILKQTYSNLEVVVMDGGSSDETLSVLSKIDDPRFYWSSQSDKGQSDAIIKGFEYGAGNFDYWNWLGSDDLYAAPDSLEKMVAMITREGCDLFFGGGEYVDENEMVIGRYRSKPTDLETIYEGCDVCQPSVLIKKSAYLKTAGIDRKLKSIMDYDLWIKLLEAGVRPCSSSEIYTYYRIHTRSKTSALRSVTYAELFRLFQKKGKKIPYPYFSGAVRECIVDPRFQSQGVKNVLYRLMNVVYRVGLLHRFLPLLFVSRGFEPIRFAHNYTSLRKAQIGWIEDF